MPAIARLRVLSGLKTPEGTIPEKGEEPVLPDEYADGETRKARARFERKPFRGRR